MSKISSGNALSFRARPMFSGNVSCFRAMHVYMFSGIATCFRALPRVFGHCLVFSGTSHVFGQRLMFSGNVSCFRITQVYMFLGIATCFWVMHVYMFSGNARPMFSVNVSCFRHGGGGRDLRVADYRWQIADSNKSSE